MSMSATEKVPARHLLPAAGPARFGPICGLRSEITRGPKSANNGRERVQQWMHQKGQLFDHLVCPGEQRGANQPAGFDAFTRRIYRRDWRRPLKLLLKNHSIISVTRTKNDSGMVKPSAFAVVLLKTRSNLSGCSTGMSAGFEPRRILST